MRYIYILANKDQSKLPHNTKIGQSSNPENRMKQLRLDKVPYWGFQDIYLYGVYQYDGGQQHFADELERAAHKYFRPYRSKLSGFDGCTEFFNIAPELAERFLLKAGAKKLPNPTAKATF